MSQEEEEEEVEEEEEEKKKKTVEADWPPGLSCRTSLMQNTGEGMEWEVLGTWVWTI